MYLLYPPSRRPWLGIHMHEKPLLPTFATKWNFYVGLVMLHNELSCSYLSAFYIPADQWHCLSRSLCWFIPSFVISKFYIEIRLHQWCRTWGCRGFNSTPKNFDLLKIWAKSKKSWAKKFRHFLTILMKLYLFFSECINKSLLCHRSRIKYCIYKINKLFLVTSCFSIWELTSNCLTWKFRRKRHFI